MSTVIQRSNHLRLHIKGASEIVLKKCTKILTASGESKPLTAEDYNHLLRDVIEPMTGDGLRTICIAYKDFDHLPEDWNDEGTVISDLTCLCLCGIEDPIRPEVDRPKEVLSLCLHRI